MRALSLLMTSVLLASGAAHPASAPAPADLTPQQRGALERIALARARAALWDKLRAAPLAPDLTLGAWSARDLARDRAVRLWVRQQPAAGPARCYRDGVCEVDVRLEPQALALKLRELQAVTVAGETPLPAAAFDAAAAHWPVFWGSGSAVAAEHATGPKPAGWEDVSFDGLEIARRAATADAVYALVAEAGRMKVTNALRLHQFLDSAPAVRDAVRSAIERSAAVNVTHAPDQVAVAEATLELTDLIRILSDVHQSAYAGDEFRASDFREMALIAGEGRLAAIGLAPPPSDTILRPAFRNLDLDEPPWAATTLRFSGLFQAPAGGPLPPAAQLDAARLDGFDRARNEVEQLVVQGEVTVEQLLEFAPQLKDDVILFLSSARDVAAPRRTGDGGLELPLELPLRRLWEILGQALETVEVDELPASQPATATAPGSAPAPATQPSSSPATAPATDP